MALNNAKKRTLIFSTAYHPFVGGAEVAIKEITDRLTSGFEFDLITSKLRKDLPKVEKIGGVTVYRVGFGRPSLDKILLPFLGAIAGSRLLKKNDYHCFWGMMVTFGTGAGYIINICRTLSGKNKVPMVLTLQEGDSEEHLTYRWGGLIGLSWKLALRKADIVTGISNFLIHRAENNGYEGRSFLVPNGVNIKLFSEKISDKVKDDLKKRLGKKEGDVFLVTTGRLTKKNAVDNIISSLRLLPENIILIVIGEGEDGFKLQKQASDLGVSSRVKFLGFLPYEKLPQYLSVCDIFIRPSRSEGFGNSFIEAMAAKLPVMATPVGGIVDFIDDKETGVFCSPDNPKSIAMGVNLILSDTVLKEKITEKAYSRVVEKYDWGNVALQMGEVFAHI